MNKNMEKKNIIRQLLRRLSGSASCEFLTVQLRLISARKLEQFQLDKLRGPLLTI